MDLLGHLASFFLFFLLIQDARQGDPNKNFTHEEGGSVNFDTGVSAGATFASVLLRSASQRKALALWVPGKPINVIAPAYSGRITFEEERRAFQIHRLTLADGGIYEILKNKDDGTAETLRAYSVFVFNISGMASQLSNRSCSLDLRCEAGAGSRGVTYSWKNSATGVTVSSDAWTRLLVGPKDKGNLYTCTAQALGRQGAWDVDPHKYCGAFSGAAGCLRPGLLLAPALLLALWTLLW